MGSEREWRVASSEAARSDALLWWYRLSLLGERGWTLSAGADGAQELAPDTLLWAMASPAWREGTVELRGPEGSLFPVDGGRGARVAGEPKVEPEWLAPLPAFEAHWVASADGPGLWRVAYGVGQPWERQFCEAGYRPLWLIGWWLRKAEELMGAGQEAWLWTGAKRPPGMPEWTPLSLEALCERLADAWEHTTGALVWGLSASERGEQPPWRSDGWVAALHGLWGRGDGAGL